MEENVKPLVGFVLYVLRGSLTIFYGNYLAAVSGKNKNMYARMLGTKDSEFWLEIDAYRILWFPHNKNKQVWLILWLSIRYLLNLIKHN